MAYANFTVDKLKSLLRERGIHGYSGKRKAELIAMLERGAHPHPALQHRELLRVTHVPIIDKRNENPREVTHRVNQHTYSVPIDPEDYIDVYLPQGIRLSPEYRETGLEQKYGGSVPLFVEGDVWPTERMLNPNSLTNLPLAFVAQFIDPRGDPNQLTQIFLLDTEDMDNGVEGSGKRDAYIKLIDLNRPHQQIILPEPYDTPNAGMIEKPILITGWIIKGELDSEDSQSLIDRLNAKIPPADEDPEYIIDEVNDIVGFYQGFKVGGIGNSCQANDYTHDYQNVYANTWGDFGSLHIDTTGKVWGDMC